MGRGWPARHHRSPVPALLQRRLVEWPGSDPQGAPVRVDRSGRQPRRRREGVLLLPRVHSYALLPQGALQVPAGPLPLRLSGGREPAALEERSRARAGRYRHLRRRALLRRVRRVCEGVHRGHPDPPHDREPRARGGEHRSPAHPVVPQRVELGAYRRGLRAPSAAGEGGRRRRAGPERRARGLPARRGGCGQRTRVAVYRERDQRRAAVRRRRPAPVREGRLSRVRDRGPARGGQPGTSGDQGRRAVSADDRAGRRRHHSTSAPPSRSRGRAIRVGVRPGVRGPDSRGRRVLPEPVAAPDDPGGTGGSAPGLRRAALEQAVLPLRGERLAGGRPGPAAATGEPEDRPQRRSGRRYSIGTSSRCRTSGSIPGSRRGTSHST